MGTLFTDVAVFIRGAGVLVGPGAGVEVGPGIGVALSPAVGEGSNVTTGLMEGIVGVGVHERTGIIVGDIFSKYSVTGIGIVG